MSNAIKGVKVGNEVKKIDYNSLDNLPDLSGIEANATAIEKTKEALESNFIKGSAVGQTVSVDDVLPINHTITVTVSSKNIIPPFTASKTVSYGTVTQSCEAGGQNVTLNGTATQGGGRSSLPSTTFKLKKGCTYTLSQELLNGTAGKYAVCVTAKGISTPVVTVESTGESYHTFTATEDMECYVGINVVTDAEYVDAVIRFQVEFGNTATDYAPYVDPSTTTLTYGGETYTPNSDGSVEGLTSTYPTMEMSVPEGFTVCLEYNQDTNAVIKKLTNAIVALGGTV